MSHYTVFVIGENPEEQLQPFHEFECTGIDDQYVQDIDITEDVRREGLGYYGLEDRTITDLSQIDREETHKYGYALVSPSGEIIKAIDRSNPNKKWDWYQLGGRWRGFFAIKSKANAAQLGDAGVFNNAPRHDADQAYKRDIDFSYMRDKAGQEAAGEYDRFHAIVQGREIPVWSEIREKHPDNIDAAREEWRNHPVNKDLNESEEFRHAFLFSDGPDQFAESRADFIEKARNKAITTYAMIYNGEWIAKGDMGWWGMSHDAMTQDEWNKKFNEFIDSLPDDTLLSVYDCHI